MNCIDIPKEQWFHLFDGSSVDSLEALIDKIKSMGIEQFTRYITKDKNDFANWIKDVLRMPKLAQQLRGVSDILEVVALMEKFAKDNELKEKFFAEKLEKKKEIPKEPRKEEVKQEKTIEQPVIKKESSEQPVKKLSLKEKLKNLVKKDKSILPTEHKSIDNEKKLFDQQKHKEHVSRVDQFLNERLHGPGLMESETMDKELETLNQEILKIKQELSELRKKGKSTLIPDLLLRQVLAKVEVWKTSFLEKDLEDVKERLINIHKEIEEVDKEIIINIKKEIEEKFEAYIQSQSKEEGKATEEQ